MRKNDAVLREFCKIAIEIEKERRSVKRCECCKIYFSSQLYVIKTLIFGIYHVCNYCKDQLEINPADGQVTFVSKFT